MTLEFQPVIKSINIASEDLTKITLEFKNGSLNGKYDSLRKYSGQTVHMMIIPEQYSYTQNFDRSTGNPVDCYVVNTDGTVEFVKQEQTQLEIDEKGNIDIEERNIQVPKEVVDEFILRATTLEFPGLINPRDVVSRLRQGEDLGEIAEDYEMSDAALIDELQKARNHAAGYADAWNKNRSEIVFPELNLDDFENQPSAEKENEETQEDNDPDPESAESEESSAENTDSDDDPY